MDYEKMKALMETNRPQSVAQRKAQVKEFRESNCEANRTYSGYEVEKEPIAA